MINMRCYLMLNGSDFGKAIGLAIQRKLDAKLAASKAEIARHFKIKPPSLSDWVKKGSVAKDKLPELWRYFSDVAGPEHWGMTASEWPAGLTEHRTAGRIDQPEAQYQISPKPPSANPEDPLIDDIIVMLRTMSHDGLAVARHKILELLKEKEYAHPPGEAQQARKKA